MKVTVTVKQEVEVKTLHVKAGVRYWEDSDINGENDSEDGENVPCKVGSLWAPIIDVDSGKILNWEQGKTAYIHYKVCDNGSYYLKDAEGKTVLSLEREYVPSSLCPEERGYGDYIIMNVDENGQIQGWKLNIDDFPESND